MTRARLAVTWEQQNRDLRRPVMPLRNTEQMERESMQMTATNQKVPVNSLTSEHLICPSSSSSISMTTPFYQSIWSAWVSRQAAVMAQPRLKTQMPAEAMSAVPRLPLASQIRGVTAPLRALPSSGRVTATEKAKESYLPLNHMEMMAATAQMRPPLAIPKNMRAMRMQSQLQMQPPTAMMDWKTTMAQEKMLRLSLTPKQSTKQPRKKQLKMLGTAKTVQSS